jgi:hypothetical protein
MPTRTEAPTARETSVSRRSRSGPKSASPGPAPGSPAAELASRPGLRMRPYRPMRALVGTLIVVASVVVAIAIYTRVGDRTEYLELTRSVLAGEQITDADLRVVSLSSDDDLDAIAATARSSVVGQYARYRLRAGSFVGTEDIQPNPIVTPGAAGMSVAILASEIPPGLRERSRVALVVSSAPDGGDRPPPVRVEATVTAIPGNIVEARTSAEANRVTVTIGIEVPPESMDVIAEAESISIALIDVDMPFPVSPAQAPTGGPDDPVVPQSGQGAAEAPGAYGPTTLPPPPVVDATATTVVPVDAEIEGDG